MTFAVLEQAEVDAYSQVAGKQRAAYREYNKERSLKNKRDEKSRKKLAEKFEQVKVGQ